MLLISDLNSLLDVCSVDLFLLFISLPSHARPSPSSLNGRASQSLLLFPNHNRPVTWTKQNRRVNLVLKHNLFSLCLPPALFSYVFTSHCLRIMKFSFFIGADQLLNVISELIILSYIYPRCCTDFSPVVGSTNQ